MESTRTKEEVVDIMKKTKGRGVSVRKIAKLMKIKRKTVNHILQTGQGFEKVNPLWIGSNKKTVNVWTISCHGP